MYRRNQSEPDGKKDKAEPGESDLAKPFDHAPEDSRPNEHAHSSEVHHEIANIRFGYRQAVGENKRKCRDRAVEATDGDGVDPDQTLSGLPGAGDDTPNCAGTRLRHYFVFAGNGAVVLRFTEIDAGEDADENAEDGRRDSRSVMTPAYQHGTDGGSHYRTETGRRGEPAETLGAIVGITGIGNVGLNDPNCAAAKTLHDTR